MSDAAPALTVVARRYETGEPVRIEVARGVIERVSPAWPGQSLPGLPWVAPGLFDLQINGYGGVSFTSATVTAEQVRQVIRALARHGIAQLCPTLVTASHAELTQGLKAIDAACRTDPLVAAMVPGIHLEGPWLSPEDGPRGAHPRQHIRPADWEEFQALQQAAGGRICLTTIAPEVAGAVAFITRAVAAGVTVSLGHTAADGGQITAAVEAGARLSTHLGNGCAVQMPRHPNPIWEQLGESRLTACVIADGHHLPPSVVRSLVRAKGLLHTVLTCDASGWAGCPAGRYQTPMGEIEIAANGRIGVAGNPHLLAGSGATTEVCVQQAAWMGACTLPQAFEMASRNPARVLGFREYRLMPGDPAHLLLYRPGATAADPLQVLGTLVGGQWAYGGA
ncbi:MAG: N-acetylglucosamine-6-phosphate deacetylase [Planctomycetaceae bacterium]